MKKFICAVLALTLALSLAACGGKTQETAPVETAPAQVFHPFRANWVY